MIFEVENPVCGDQLRVSARIGESVSEIRFRARGCTAVIACASAMTELVTRKRRGDLARVDAAAIEAAVGGLIPESKHAAVLCADAVRRMMSEWM